MATVERMPFGLKTRKTELRRNEVVVFFPTCASFDAEAGEWHVPIHGWIYNPKRAALRRSAVLGVFRRYIRIDRAEARNSRFFERARLFVVDNKRGKRLSIRLGGREFWLEPSRADGHIHANLRLTDDEVASLPITGGDSCGWLAYEAGPAHGGAAKFRGAVQLAPRSGLSIISDIDDTIKVSHVTNRRALLHNTFLHDYQAVHGMAEVFAHWSEKGAAFHYVSSSPWQLYGPLAGFFMAEGFPRGSFHMRPFQMKLFRRRRPKPRGPLPAAAMLKHTIITQLIERMPTRRFVLLGDSGQHDPEIYGGLARRFPAQVIRCLIRDVTARSDDAARFEKAFEGTNREMWSVFRHPSEIDVANLTLPVDEGPCRN